MSSPATLVRSSARALGLACLLAANVSAAEQVVVAVASNFLRPLRELAAVFAAESEHETVIVAGSTGQIYAQILNGAPYEIFLAADRERPRLLAANGFGAPDSVFTYAVGRLALWSADADRVRGDTLVSLGEASFRWFAIADPELAPYGAAARQVLENLDSWEPLQPRLVRGQNIGQAFAMVQTGNAELGLVALSQALSYRGAASHSVVPASLHDPIAQDAILLERGKGKAAANEFLTFLKGEEAAAVMARFGYDAGGYAD